MRLLNKPERLFKSAITFCMLLMLANCGGGGSDEEVSSVNPPPNSPPPANQPPTQTAANVIAAENAKPGNGNWRLVNPAVGGEIEGYASLTSVNLGDSIDFHVRTTAATYNIDVFRMGYYDGVGARLMQSIPNLARQSQPMPCAGPNNLIECDWSVSHSLRIPSGQTNPAASDYWASGVYLAKLSTNTDPVRDSYIIFVVRDDARRATYVSQLPVTTYQAYNFWGGKSLYTGCDEGHENGWQCANRAGPAQAVSFNRPYGRSAAQNAAQGLGAGEFITNVQPARVEGYNISSAGWDYNMLRWMERQGYDIKYISNLDLHENSGILNQAKAFISTGHDEYYSKAMWDRLVDARSAGINLAFFSANQVFWQVRFADGSVGSSRRNRTMICYRGGGDPVTDNNLTTDQFRYLGRPEASLLGNQYVKDPIVGDVTLTNTAHWLFAGSGATNSTVLRGLLGYEINAHVPGVSPSQTKILSHSVVDGYPSNITYYVDASSTQVFSTGTMQWSWGLDNFIPGSLRSDYTSAIAQKITANLFDAVGEKNLATFTNSAAALDLGTPTGELGGGPVVIQAAPSNNSRTNQWRLVASNEQNYFHLVSRANGLCLQVLGSQAGTRDCDSGNDQKWRVSATGSTAAIVAKSRGACLTAPASSAGTQLTLSSCNDASNQQWANRAVGS